MKTSTSKMSRIVKYGLAALLSGVMAYQGIRQSGDVTEALSSVTPVERSYLNAKEAAEQTHQNRDAAAGEWRSSWIGPNGETLNIHTMSDEKYLQYQAMLDSYMKPHRDAENSTKACLDSIASSDALSQARSQREKAQGSKAAADFVSYLSFTILGGVGVGYLAGRKK